jgi:hypothetical protein
MKIGDYGLGDRWHLVCAPKDSKERALLILSGMEFHNRTACTETEQKRESVEWGGISRARVEEDCRVRFKDEWWYVNRKEN